MKKNKKKEVMTPLTEHQFHTVWTTAVGKEGYSKKLFQETLAELKDRGLVIDMPS